jgi:hypothetical protein
MSIETKFNATTSSVDIIHLENVENESDGVASEVFSFQKVSGGRGHIAIPRDVAYDLKKSYDLLLKHNADLPSKEEAISELERAIKARPERFLLRAARTGWRDDNSAFITPWETFDSQVARRQKIVPPQRINDAQRHGKQPKGTLEGWKSDVARRCGYSDLGMTLLSAAFAAPLLALTNRPSFALSAYGTGKCGKSVLLVAASSVAGAGSEEHLPDWAATTPAMGELFRLHCDGILPINETGLIPAEKAYSHLAPAIYQIAQGREREKHSASSFATTDASAFYRVVVAITSEHSIDEYASRVGKKRDAGEYARCIEIPATRNGRTTVVDRYPKTVPPEEGSNWSRGLLKNLRDACKANHGVAIKPYIHYLMKDIERAERRTRHYMAQFVETLDTAAMSEATKHAADNASLLYAGSCLAVDAKVLDYDKSDLMRAIRRCFLDAIQTSDPLAKGKLILKRRLKDPSVLQQGNGEDVDADQHDGYVVREAGRRQYVIHAATFRAWFDAEPATLNVVLEWLARERYLSPPKSRTHKAGARPAGWAERVVPWPGGRPTRSIVFEEPFGLRR